MPHHRGDPSLHCYISIVSTTHRSLMPYFLPVFFFFAMLYSCGLPAFSASRDAYEKQVRNMMQRGADKESIIHCCSLGLEQSPKDAFLLLERGVHYRLMREFKKSLQDLNLLVEVCPNSMSAYEERGILYQEMGKNGAALKDLNRAISISPTVNALLARASIHKMRKDYTGALADADAALKLTEVKGSFFSTIPNYKTRAYEMRADCFEGMHQYIKAINELTLALKFEEGVPRFLDEYAKVGDRAKWTRSNTSVRGIFERKAKLYEKLGDNARAAENYSLYICMNPTRIEGYLTRASLYTKLGKLQNAVADHTRAIELDKGNPRLYYARAKCYKAFGKTDLERKDIKAAEDLESSFLGGE